ncbi:CRISPR system Cmr subunit Cmr6 [uncultured archaeon]|nr:CRISPR system Cmr subunit Cmr6 [uncultured archaeon]
MQVAVKDEEKNHSGARKNLFAAMCRSLEQSEAIYGAAYKRQETAFKDLKSRGIFKTAGRLIIGLGEENVLETGLTLHHTYGTPIIPGTALKGLAAHYCNQTWGAADDRFKLGGEYHQTIFGTTDDSGHIIFYDAWVTPQSLKGSLQPDVMTPHHGEYYSDEKGMTPPTDFDDPKPVTFLSVSGNFCIAVSCDVPSPGGQEWAVLVFGLLSDALREWGIGGKTNAGYGRLVLESLGESGSMSVNETKPETKFPSKGVDVQKAQKSAPPSASKLKYKKGDMVEVTRIADPKEKRGALYFKATDGIGGMVVQGVAPSIELGQNTQLVICGVMEKEGLYNFAAVGAKKAVPHQLSNRRRR